VQRLSLCVSVCESRVSHEARPLKLTAFIVCKALSWRTRELASSCGRRSAGARGSWRHHVVSTALAFLTFSGSLVCMAVFTFSLRSMHVVQC
jgi:hypothetical protein